MPMNGFVVQELLRKSAGAFIYKSAALNNTIKDDKMQTGDNITLILQKGTNKISANKN